MWQASRLRAEATNSCQGMFFLLNLVFRVITRRKNLRRDAAALQAADMGQSRGGDGQNSVRIQDQTDKQNPHFRYLA